MNVKKIVTVLNYLASKIGPVDKLKVVKLLYFIDKRHFIQYGRFVTNDCYIKMPLGPVPSNVLDVIDNPDEMLGKPISIISVKTFPSTRLQITALLQALRNRTLRSFQGLK